MKDLPSRAIARSSETASPVSDDSMIEPDAAPLELPRGRTVPEDSPEGPAAYRTRRLFASSAALIMVLVAFAVLVQEARAEAVQPFAPPSEMYGPGWKRVANPDGTVTMTYLRTFQRWDGAWRPAASLNRSTGEWPYQLADGPSTMSVTRLGATFSQAKIPGAAYEFRDEAIKETIAFQIAPPSPMVSVAFTTSGLDVHISDNAVTLKVPSGETMWTARDFHAWDSSPVPQMWPDAVTSLTYSGGVLTLTLNTDMLANAVYPLYVDPTWTLSAAVGWGASTFQDAAEDRGDHQIKIGWLADNFDDNVNEIWTIDAGAVTFSGGVMNVPGGSSVHAGGPWYDQNFSWKVNFVTLGGVGFAFRHVDVNNYYQVFISGSTGYVGLEKRVGGVGTSLGSFTTPISGGTWYDVSVVAQGNSFEVWWDNVKKLALTDANPPTPFSGHVQVWTSAAPTSIQVDSVRVRNTDVGTMTTPVRDAGTNRPLDTRVLGYVNAYDQLHVRIRSSADNVTWGPWTNLKTDITSGTYHKVPDQDRQRYYQLRITLTTGWGNTPELWEVTTSEGTPTTNPTANTGSEALYPYVGGLANAVNGNLWYSKRDLSIQARAFTLAIVRSYNSLRGAEVGPFGNGWTHNYDEKLVVTGDQTVTWNDGDGSQHIFTPKGTSGGYGSPRGITSRLVKNPDTTFTLWHTDGSKEDFTSAGRLSKISDNNGNKVTLTYDGGNRLTGVADDSGTSLTLGYDVSNRISTVTDPLSRQIVYTYDGSSNLVAVKDPMNFYENYTYAVGKLSAIIDPVGKRTGFSYDGSSRVTEIWLGLYQSGSVVWQFRDYLITYPTATTRTITNARGFSTTLTLNSFGNPTQRNGPSVGSACCDDRGNSSSFVWDGEMRKIKTTDGRGNAWTMDYDQRSNLLSTTDPGGNVSSSVWAERNYGTWYSVLLKSQTNFRGYATTYTYDGKDNLIVIKDAKNDSAYLYYDALGFLNRSKDFRGYDTWLEYNANGYMTKVTDPLNQKTQYGYDAVGRQTTVTSPLGFVTTTIYDPDDRVTKVTDPLGNFTSFEHNARGDRTKVTDPNGFSTLYAINVTNHRAQIVTDAPGNQTTLSYDLRGSLLSVKDANDHVTTYEYDAHDRPTKVTSPMGFQTSYTYDAAGNQISRKDANGNTTTYTFDTLNRIAKIAYPGGSVVTYAYDKNGNPTSEVGFGYAKTTNYGELDRATSVVLNYGSFSKTTNYTYDANGNRLTLKDGEGGTTSYVYDAANRLTQTTDPEGRVFAYAYDGDSRRTSTKYPNNVWTNETYDKASRVKTVYTNRSGGQMFESFVYTYDKAGNPLTMTDGGATTTYEYDELDRLTKEIAPSGFTTTYAYDAVGNRISKTTGSATTTYAYDADDRLTQETLGSVAVTYEYDGNGNRIREWDVPGNVTRYFYDPENRLVQVRYPSGTTCNYTYTPSGERMSAGCSPMTYYGYDLHGSQGFEDVVAEYDSSGARQARYTHGPGIDEPVGVLRGGSHYGYHADAVGSVTRITDSAQGTSRSYRYDAWGRIVDESGSLTNAYTFTGREKDPAGALYYYRARMYDPDVGRFTSRDPSGMVDGPNLHAYAGNNPTSRNDPSGRLTIYIPRNPYFRIWIGDSYVEYPTYPGYPPYHGCTSFIWWTYCPPLWMYPAIHFYFSPSGANRLLAELSNFANALPDYLGAIVEVGLGFRVPLLHYFERDKNRGGSLDWWVPIDIYNQILIFGGLPFYSATPHYWWRSWWIQRTR